MSGAGLVLRICVFVVDDGFNGLLGGEVDEDGATQAVVRLDQARDYVNRRLSFLSAECTCDVSPV